jgi:hypothetical protein
MDDVSPARILAENMRFAGEHSPPGIGRPALRDPDPKRRLRVGYVTSDLRAHSVARNMLGIFAHRNRADFETHVYAEIERPDAFTDLFRGMSDGWVSTVGMDDDAAAARVRVDGIDVLVLVAGHFGPHPCNSPPTTSARRAPRRSAPSSSIPRCAPGAPTASSSACCARATSTSIRRWRTRRRWCRPPVSPTAS